MNDLDWIGGAAVLGAMFFILAGGLLINHAATRRVRRMVARAENEGIIPRLPRTADHTWCAGCDLTLCYCTPPCPGVDQAACVHFNPLCSDCAVSRCDDCLDAFRQDYGVGR